MSAYKITELEFCTNSSQKSAENIIANGSYSFADAWYIGVCIKKHKEDFYECLYVITKNKKILVLDSAIISLTEDAAKSEDYLRNLLKSTAGEVFYRHCTI